MNKVEESHTSREVCEVCRADYEGNEPRNCKIYNNTGYCKFIAKEKINTRLELLKLIV